MVWYGGQFYALFFLTQTLKVPAVTAWILIAVSLAIGTPCFILFGWLSDKIGRKPIMLAGFALAVVTYFPIFGGITHFANPKLEHALAAAPVIVTADPNQCSFQFKATGTEKFTTACDIIKSTLVNLSVNYDNVKAPAGTKASVKIGDTQLNADTPNLPADDRRGGEERTAIRRAPIRRTSTTPMTVLLLAILVVYVTMVYGPIAAWLVELFPTRIRYSGSVAALSHRQRLVRRLPAGDRLRHRGGDRQHLLRPLVPDRDRGDELRRRADLPARDQGSRHHQDVTNGGAACTGRPPSKLRTPRTFGAGRFFYAGDAAVIRRS